VERGNKHHASIKNLIGDPDYWPLAEEIKRKFISTKHALPRLVQDRRPVHQEQEEAEQQTPRRNPPRGQVADEQQPRREYNPEEPYNRKRVWVSVVRERRAAPPPT